MVEYPQKRQELIDKLHDLSNRKYQQKVWIEKAPPYPYDSFDETINILYDDHRLSEGAAGMVGIILKDQEEANLIQNVINSIDRVRVKVDNGPKKRSIFHMIKQLLAAKKPTPAEYYLNCPEWQDVIKNAALACKKLSSQE